MAQRDHGPFDEDCPGRSYSGTCLGYCHECSEHLHSTGRYTTYCPSCDVCPECFCPNADGFAHYRGCSIAAANETADSDD